MKLFYLISLGMLCSLPMKAHSPELVDRHPMAIKEEMSLREDNVRKVTEEAKSRLLNAPSLITDETTGISLEGEWNFKMEGLMYDDLTNTNWYGMLVGSTLLLEEYTKTSYPIIGEFDKENNKLIISKKYVGMSWRGRYIYIHPYTVENGKVVPGTITADYNPETGVLKFNPGDYLAWIDYKNYEGTEDPYDEGAWYIVMSANRIGDLDKEKSENWDYQGDATIIDGWVTPRFGLEQNREENWLKAELYKYKNNPNIYRLKKPFKELEVEGYEMFSNTGYIEFDVKDPEHVAFNRIDTGWTCPQIGINKFYCYNILGYYLSDYKMRGEDYSVSDFLLFFNPYIPFTTFKDGIVDLGGILYAGEIVYDANFGEVNYPTGGNMWTGFNMRSRIYFPGINVTEPQIDFEDEPVVTFDTDTKSAVIDVKFTYENKPENATVFVMVFDKDTGKMVARKYVNASKYDNEYSFVLGELDPERHYNYVMRVQMEGGLSEVLAKSELKDLVFSADSNDPRPSGVEGLESDTNIPVYYNLQGVRIDNPIKGEIYIMKKGNKAVKVIF